MVNKLILNERYNMGNRSHAGSGTLWEVDQYGSFCPSLKTGQVDICFSVKMFYVVINAFSFFASVKCSRNKLHVKTKEIWV